MLEWASKCQHRIKSVSTDMHCQVPWVPCCESNETNQTFPGMLHLCSERKKVYFLFITWFFCLIFVITKHINTKVIKVCRNWQTLVAHGFNPSTWEAEAGRSLWVPGQPDLQSKCQDRLQSYTEKPCLEKPKTKTKNKTKMHKAWGRGSLLQPCRKKLCLFGIPYWVW